MTKKDDFFNLDRESWYKALKDANIIKGDNTLILRPSELPTLLGENKYKSSSEHILQKLAGEKFLGNEFTELGQKLEAHIIEEALDHFALSPLNKDKWNKYYEVEIGYINTEYGDIRVVLGGKVDAFGFKIVRVGDQILDRKYVIEVKAMLTHRKEDYAGNVPPHYQSQVLAYMLMFQSHVAFYALTGSGPLAVELIADDYLDDIINFKQNLFDVAKSIVDKSILEQNTSFIRRKVTSNNAHTKVIKDLKDLLLANKKLVEEYKVFENKKSFLKNKIVEKIGTGEFYVDGHKLIIKEYTNSYFDVDALKEELPEIYQRYLKTRTNIWVGIDNAPESYYYDEEI